MSWAGYAFENICFKHIHSIVEALKISVIAKDASYWAYYPKKNDDYSGAQIDLIIDRTDQTMNLCEIKFSSQEYTMEQPYADRLNKRREIFRSLTSSKKSLFVSLITPYGATRNGAFLSAVDQQLNLDSLFLC